MLQSPVNLDPTIANARELFTVIMVGGPLPLSIGPQGEELGRGHLSPRWLLGVAAVPHVQPLVILADKERDDVHESNVSPCRK